MARLRNRIIKADFWTDGELLRWPRDKRFTYAGLYSMAEDSGCLEDDPFMWKMLLWPAPTDAGITVENLEAWRDEMVAAGKLVRYEAGGESLLFIRSFHEHEHPRNPQSPNLPTPAWVRYVPGDREKKTRNHYEVDLGAAPPPPANGKLAVAKVERAVGMRAKKKDEDDGSFELFWAFYPRREGRRTAETAWKYVDKSGREMAIGVAQVMGVLYQNGQKEKKYIPLPTTFIHQERWMDWSEGIPAGWQDSSQERAAQQEATIDAAIRAAYGDEEDE